MLAPNVAAANGSGDRESLVEREPRQAATELDRTQPHPSGRFKAPGRNRNPRRETAGRGAPVSRCIVSGRGWLRGSGKRSRTASGADVAHGAVGELIEVLAHALERAAPVAGNRL